ncbi:MAG: hypothetical protein ACRD5B_01175 [Nitrososphaeraceae archaeon]
MKKSLIIGDFVVTATLASSWIICPQILQRPKKLLAIIQYETQITKMFRWKAAHNVCSIFTETGDNMLHREGGLLLGVCQESEFMEIHALNPRITTILNPYFSKLCVIVPIE